MIYSPTSPHKVFNNIQEAKDGLTSNGLENYYQERGIMQVNIKNNT
ncbi:HNH endonuclease [Staphylococcus phage Metroid]|nr:HNH endonuclease [Staphylococcus phage Metroid]